MPTPLGSDFHEVRASGIHGMGIFARRDIPQGSCVIEYLGERVSKAESLRHLLSVDFLNFCVIVLHTQLNHRSSLVSQQRSICLRYR